MTTRYFKATDGTRTYFRSTATREYQSCCVLRGGPSFSKTPASLLAGSMPAVEISRVSYMALVEMKNRRLVAEGREPRGYTQPYHSWIEGAV